MNILSIFAVIVLGAQTVCLGQRATVQHGLQTVILPDTCRGQVLRVVDGDTYIVGIERFGAVKVRVVGIDTYETRYGERLTLQANRADMSIDSALQLGWAAKMLCDSLLRGRTVTLVRYKTLQTDVYGRVLRLVYIDGENIATILQRRGLQAAGSTWNRKIDD